MSVWSKSDAALWSGQFCRSVMPGFVETILYHPSSSHQRGFSGFLFSRIFLFILFIDFLLVGLFLLFVFSKIFLSSHSKIFIPRWIALELFSIVKNVLKRLDRFGPGKLLSQIKLKFVIVFLFFEALNFYKFSRHILCWRRGFELDLQTFLWCRKM